MAVLTRKDHGSTRPANAVGAEAVPKQHPLTCQGIDVRCWVKRFVDPVVSADRMRCVIVAENEDDIWATLGLRKT